MKGYALRERVLPVELYELIDGEVNPFLDSELIGKFQAKPGENIQITDMEIDDLREAATYLFGFFSCNMRNVRKLLLQYLYDRSIAEDD